MSASDAPATCFTIAVDLIRTELVGDELRFHVWFRPPVDIQVFRHTLAPEEAAALRPVIEAALKVYPDGIGQGFLAALTRGLEKAVEEEGAA